MMRSKSLGSESSLHRICIWFKYGLWLCLSKTLFLLLVRTIHQSFVPACTCWFLSPVVIRRAAGYTLNKLPIHHRTKKNTQTQDNLEIFNKLHAARPHAGIWTQILLLSSLEDICWQNQKMTINTFWLFCNRSKLLQTQHPSYLIFTSIISIWVLFIRKKLFQSRWNCFSPKSFHQRVC